MLLGDIVRLQRYKKISFKKKIWILFLWLGFKKKHWQFSMKTAQICLHRIWFSGTHWVLPYLYGRLPMCSAHTIGHVVPIYTAHEQNSKCANSVEKPSWFSPRQSYGLQASEASSTNPMPQNVFHSDGFSSPSSLWGATSNTLCLWPEMGFKNAFGT